jgi:CheY-like chemotaxis protein
VVQTGEEILAKLKERKFDLLLLDIVLPEISGWDILGKIKEQSSKSKNLKDLKIIILSNLGQKSEVEKALKLGAVRYLIKTHYTPSEVVEEVKKILG